MTKISSHKGAFARSTKLRNRTSVALGLSALVLAGCSSDQLNIVNPNTPSFAGAGADAQAVQLQASGLLFDLRGNRGGYISSTGVFGRELFNYTPQEPRNVTNYLIGIAGQNQLDRNGFAAAPNWNGPYSTLRDVYNFKKTVAALATLTAEQKSAALGFAQTIEAIELLSVISTRDSLGGVVEVKEDPQQVAAFVSRDSMYKYILNTLDAANTSLTAGGTAFPFTLSSGFVGFNTPTTFRTFNRAIAARAAAYYATAEGGAAAWQRSLTANAASFANTAATTRAQFDVGPFHPYGGSPDVPNPQVVAAAGNIYAHPSILTDVLKKPDGSNDNRYTAKVGPKADRAAPGGFGINSNLGYILYPLITSPIPIIRNEELILLRAEGLLATGDKAGALAMINQVRVNSGGLVPTTLTTASPDADVITEILLQKRYSLLMEGHRWVDMRRYGRLSQLPLDIPTGPNAHFVPKVQPIPAGECLVRVGLPAPFAAPGC